jgi:riboflavin synthase
MFAGIVKGRGRLLESVDRGGDRRLVISMAGVDLGPVVAGDSIAVNGVCLTAVEPSESQFSADVSAETLRCTTLATLDTNDPVNLEASLKLGDAVAGHLVYGHVDAVGEVARLEDAARSTVLTVSFPAKLGRYIAVKGSVTIDGVSLTVNRVTRDRLSVNIIPHTREITVISGYEPGTPVNIEVDMLARFVERLMNADPEALNLDTLKHHGFIKSD